MFSVTLSVSRSLGTPDVIRHCARPGRLGRRGTEFGLSSVIRDELQRLPGARQRFVDDARRSAVVSEEMMN